jgi:hypothetical protein
MRTVLLYLIWSYILDESLNTGPPDWARGVPSLPSSLIGVLASICWYTFRFSILLNVSFHIEEQTNARPSLLRSLFNKPSVDNCDNYCSVAARGHGHCVEPDFKVKKWQVDCCWMIGHGRG